MNTYTSLSLPPSSSVSSSSATHVPSPEVTVTPAMHENFRFMPAPTLFEATNKLSSTTFSVVPAAPALTGIQTLKFDMRSSILLNRLSKKIAKCGGPQASGAGRMAMAAAEELKLLLSSEQLAQLQAYKDGLIPALVFDCMLPFTNDDIEHSPELPNLEKLETQLSTLQLSSRSQINLALVGQQAFAYDIDNNQQITRVVANFKGGGEQKLENEPEKAELSSHAGVALGPHTEGPYESRNGRSIAADSLILTALRNPSNQPTSVIPLATLLDNIGKDAVDALRGPYFNFTRTDSYSSGEGVRGVPIVYPDDAVCYNSYRISVDENAPLHVKAAFEAFQWQVKIHRAKPERYVLRETSALLINNRTALHARDTLTNNYRVVLRLFGCVDTSRHIVLSDDPLVVQGS